MRIEHQHLADIRNRIVEAAEEVITELGPTGATTRTIAERAGCAEGSIYRYFPDKHALFLEVVKTRFPQFLDMLEGLPDRAGTGTVQGILEEVVINAMQFFRAVLPVVIATMSEHKLLHQQRRYWEETNTGPLHSIGLLTTYFRREQRLGRISSRVSAEHLTRLVLGPPFVQAFMLEHVGSSVSCCADQRFATEIVRSLIAGLSHSGERDPTDTLAGSTRL